MATRSRRPRGLSANHVNEEERLETILNDKSTLLSVRLLGKENWVKIEERPNCFYCARRFRPFSLKRHCRSCGEIVCSNCYRRRKVRVTSTLEVTVRLCFDCIDKAMLVAESDSINVGVPVMERLESIEKEDETEVMKMQNSIQGKGMKKNQLDSTQTSTCTSISTHFSDFSSSKSLSDVESDLNDTTKLIDKGNFLSSISRGHGKNVIEFLTEHEQLKIYEARRHEILTQLNVLDTEPEKEYDAVCELVRQALDCNVAAVAFMDQTRQWYKARYGIAQAELPRDVAFCSQLLQTSLPTIVMDVTKDPRFNQNPLVTGSANIRFYASTAICDPTTGIVIGSVFVMDPKPKHKLPLRAMEVLSYASSTVEKMLQGEYSIPSPLFIKSKSQSFSSPLRRRESMPSFSEIGTASLQSVPEELEDGDFRLTLPRSNTSSLSSTGSVRSSRRRHLRPNAFSSASNAMPRHQLLDPSVKLSSSTSTSTEDVTSTKSKLSIADLVGVESRESAPAQTAPIQLQGLDMSCAELLNRITSTQELLAQQHHTMMGTLTQHSSRISMIEETVNRIENILSAQRTQSIPRLYK
ncbi:Phosphatidylinositol-4-phosphate 5-kinase and related FYVE finger-containing proteins [Plasmopara halstedii]|uniref:Phosphatidylinositol-4-phosphate 5-kinase and related FYVE finger-containing proteins n=1 Tax=Plasmopara halstedii TaxID=4781 RepID=A0A0P1AHB0_PLAHL|nr:Phosphatidylinositol-4-phosphate 5-kinase and related FYVE finger-containing proteins [Plasmopara halstedii]CEG40064.1 Phosphatidylinositol-4-phosphate 5-kinase and related FYVE finger-containing proteins [Plasmopara halstedii]|eukprot:XP_024576433.1 Phosphatidylinositol-4-phosphate 5-kinase and related FYVE finger-containing proteins [Plasmopara halstedii]